MIRDVPRNIIPGKYYDKKHDKNHDKKQTINLIPRKNDY